MRKIPAAAAWLLQRFGVAESNESLMGDLIEEHGSGRSAWWLWRQVLVAIADTVARDLREHWLLALRAIATGWMLNLAWGRLIAAWDHYEIGRVHYGVGYGAIALMAFAVFVWPAIVGWVVARTHRAQQAAMLLAYVASVAIYETWWLIRHYAELHHAPVANQWAVDLILNCIALACTLIGGFLPRPQKRVA